MFCSVVFSGPRLHCTSHNKGHWTDYILNRSRWLDLKRFGGLRDVWGLWSYKDTLICVILRSKLWSTSFHPIPSIMLLVRSKFLFRHCKAPHLCFFHHCTEIWSFQLYTWRLWGKKNPNFCVYRVTVPPSVRKSKRE